MLILQCFVLLLHSGIMSWHHFLSQCLWWILVVQQVGLPSRSFSEILWMTMLNEIWLISPPGHCKYGHDLAVELVSALKRVLATCGSVRMSFSKRTPVKVNFVLRYSSLSLSTCLSVFLSIDNFVTCFHYLSTDLISQPQRWVKQNLWRFKRYG